MSEPPAQHLFCPHCGYDLTGLTEPRCSECGREFDADALRRELELPRTTLGRAILRILLLPLLSTGAGAAVAALANADKTGGLAIGFGALAGLSLLVGGILLSRRLANQLAVGRALKLGLAPFGVQNRGFLWMTGIGLFCCQGVLSAGGFFGGCACVLLSTANFH